MTAAEEPDNVIRPLSSSLYMVALNMTNTHKETFDAVLTVIISIDILGR
jgi:hypothetical protein